MATKSGVNEQGEAGQATGGDGVQRWTSGRKAAVVLEVIKGKATCADVARHHDLTVGEVES